LWLLLLDGKRRRPKSPVVFRHPIIIKIRASIQFYRHLFRNKFDFVLAVFAVVAGLIKPADFSWFFIVEKPNSAKLLAISHFSRIPTICRFR